MKDDEQKASEMESSSLAEEAKPAEAPAEIIPGAETRFKRFLWMAVRWAAGLLIVFALGVLAAGLALYLPTREESSNLRIELADANQRIGELESEVTRLKSLEVENETMRKDLEKANLHINILSALSDVNAAHLALIKEDRAAVRAHLTNTPRTLKNLADLVGKDQKEMVVAMEDRLDLALKEMDMASFAAEADLQVLATSLVQLENILFAKP